MEILLNAALLVAIIAYLSDRKKEKLTYITEERQKWRERVREKVPKLVKLTTNFTLREMKLSVLKKEREEAIEIANYLLLSLNPNRGEDEVLKEYLISLLNNQAISRERFVERFSILLKEEWEKGKYEASNVKEILMIPLFIIMLTLSWVLINELNINNIDLTLSFIILNVVALFKILRILFDKKNSQELLKENIKKIELIIFLFFILSLSSVIAIKLFGTDSKNGNKSMINQKFYLKIFKSNDEVKDKKNKEELSKNTLSNNDIKDNNVIISNNGVSGNSGVIENKLLENPKFSLNINSSKEIKEKKMNRVYFEFDKSDLTPSGIETIKDLVPKVGTDKKVTLITSSDTMGTKEYNLNLKKKRAETVKKELMSYGIPVENISTQIINNFIQTSDQIKEPLNKAVEIKISDKN